MISCVNAMTPGAVNRSSVTLWKHVSRCPAQWKHELQTQVFYNTTTFFFFTEPLSLTPGTWAVRFHGLGWSSFLSLRLAQTDPPPQKSPRLCLRERRGGWEHALPLTFPSNEMRHSISLSSRSAESRHGSRQVSDCAVHRMTDFCPCNSLITKRVEWMLSI